ncbi:MAG: hypothetical protein ABIY37_14605 [Devosia sp.]
MFDLFGTISRDEARGLVFRGVLVFAGLAALVAAGGFLLGWRDVVRIWPFLGYGLTPVFLASILAAIAAPVIWIGLSGEFAALRGGAANLLVTGGGIAAYGLSQSWGDPAGRVQVFAVIHLAVAMVAFLLLVASQQAEWRDDRPMPVLVRIAFGIFGLGLVAVGTGLVLLQNAFPWPLDRDTSIVYGIIFLGAAVYFAYGLRRPVWGNAKGQLIGFLAYDVVLIVPFVRLWFVAPSLSLAIYLAVIAGSALLSIWYLALSPRYRLWASEW